MKKIFAVFLGLFLFSSWGCPSMAHASMEDNSQGVFAKAEVSDVNNSSNHTDCCPETTNTQDSVRCTDNVIAATSNKRLSLKKLPLKPVGKFTAKPEVASFSQKILSEPIPKPYHFPSQKSHIKILRSMVLQV